MPHFIILIQNQLVQHQLKKQHVTLECPTAMELYDLFHTFKRYDGTMTRLLGDCEVSIQCESLEKMTALYQAVTDQYLQGTVSEELSLPAQLARALNRILFPSGTEQQGACFHQFPVHGRRGQTSKSQHCRPILLNYRYFSLTLSRTN